METRELSRSERTGIRKLVVSMCANYDSEYGCLPRDYGRCYMLDKWWTGAYCKYFRDSVLLNDPALEAALTDRAAPKTDACTECDKPIIATNNRAKYCASCAERIRLKRQREYMRKRKSAV